jgi:hypothetical protein
MLHVISTCWDETGSSLYLRSTLLFVEHVSMLYEDSRKMVDYPALSLKQTSR